MGETPTKEPTLSDEILTFAHGIEALATSFPLVSAALTAAITASADKHNDFLSKFATRAEDGNQFVLRPTIQTRVSLLRRDYNNAHLAYIAVPRSLVVSLVSQFDAFLGRLLRTLFLLKPDMLSSSERQLTLSELLDLGTVENAVDHILEKEIESVLRKSHAEQFVWMESRFKLVLRKDLDVWPSFVELTERRNLFVHTGGVVSSQYLLVCREHGVDLSGVSAGVQLDVDNKYFDRAYRVVYEIGVKLAHVLWRKVRADQLEDADRALSNVAFELINTGSLDLARTLLEFSCLTLKKHARERTRLITVINLSQTYKWMGDIDRCLSLLASEDWSAAGRDFALCVAVLRDDYTLAADLMRQIGSGGEVGEPAYRDWPVFREFRKSDVFAETFQTVFGRAYAPLEETVQPADAQPRAIGSDNDS